MLRRFFIPLTVLLVAVAVGLYFWLGTGGKPRSVRDAVPVEHYTLRNGLTLLVMPNARIPAVTHLLLVRGGGSDDPYGKTGVAHYIEHLMFSGTEANPAGEYERSVQRVGGTQNAFTTRDYTGYYATVPKAHLEMVMRLESDRFRNMRFTDAQAERELKVILEERNSRVENNPGALLAEQVDAITFLNHPYGRPLIGWQEDMQGLTGADAQRFFDRYYKPSNMVLLVAGDVEPKRVRAMAQKYFGPMAAGNAPARHWPKEPPLRLTRHAEMRDTKVQTPRLLRQYVAPSLKDGETAHATPLMVMAQYLGGGQTSLLYQRLVRESKLALSVSASYDPFAIGPGVLRISVVPREGVRRAELERALDATIEEALGQMPPEADAARAKTQLKAIAVFAQDGLEGLAELIGELYMLGLDEQVFYDWQDAIDAVTPLAMLDAAQAVLAPPRRVTAWLLPEGEAEEYALPPVAPAPVVEEAPVVDEAVEEESSAEADDAS